MLAPLDWISDYVTIEDGTEAIVYQLTQIGLEVEEVFEPSEALETLTIVELQSAEDHPNNDTLTVCTVTDGESDHTVVTAASELTTTGRYVWARPGSRLGDRNIEEQNINGVPSEGMLCSLQDMQLTGSSSALLELGTALDPGTDALEILGLNDPILEIDLTPNRSDCLSIVGIARDYAVATDRNLTLPDSPELEELATGDETIEIKVENPGRCPKYVGVPVSDASVKPSELSIVKRLVQVGIQPRNNIVDATNYVLYEMGNPLHAFDRSTLDLPIGVRCAGDEESLTTLDGTELELDTEDLVISDKNAPCALAGVMGGLNSEISESTQSLLLEGAYFSPAGVRRTSSRHQLKTDSSYRFERGVDANNVETALARSLQLMDTDGSFTVHRPQTVSTDESFTVPVDFDPSQFSTLIGYDCEYGVMEDRLEGLGCDVTDQTDDSWTVKPPSWRHDLERPEDLLEEIVRLDGYESIPSEFPSLPLSETPNPLTRLDSTLRKYLSAWGFHETTTFSFLPEEDQNLEPDTNPHRVANPISREHATLRQSILDGLIPIFTKNVDAGRERIGLFEIGRVFPGTTTDEPLHLGLIWSRELFAESWDDYNRSVDYYDLKGLLIHMLRNLGYTDCDVQPASHNGFLDDRTAELSLDDRSVGRIGQVDPATIEADTDGAVWGAELNLTSLGESPTVKYNPFSKEPIVKRDLDLVVDQDQYARDVKETIRDHAEWLEEIKIFDLYRGEPLETDKKSISFRLHFRNSERTLNDQEVNEVQESILDALRSEHGAYLRDE